MARKWTALILDFCGGERWGLIPCLWKKSGKACGMVCGKTVGKVVKKFAESDFCTQSGVKVGDFHLMVEKFCRGFTHGKNRGRGEVLHSFHSPYYHYY